MVRSVDTRWNTLASAIKRALYLSAALDKLVGLKKYDKDGKGGLRKYKLEPKEWDLLRQLWPLLEVRIICCLRLAWIVPNLLVSLVLSRGYAAAIAIEGRSSP